MRQAGFGLLAAGACSFLFPGFNGVLFERSNVTTGEGQILGAILFVGGLILLAMTRKPT
jgi:hypothetical protein